MDIIKNCGFFPEYYIKIKELCSESEVNNFNNLKSDLERIVYMGKIPEISENKVQIKREYSGKSEKISLAIKENANAAFRNKQWAHALMLYSKSYIAMPREKASDISILLANRSAALFHMKKFDNALADIKRAIGKGYPQDILYKLYERSAQCHLANKNLPEALEAFKRTMTAMDDAIISLDKRTTIERNAMIMIKMLEKTKSQEIVKVNDNVNSDVKEYVSDGLVIDYNEEEGRYAKAKRNIEIGEEIIVEKPHTFVLLEKYCKTHCQNCFKRTIIPLACPECADVVFCSEACLNLANSTYHKFECGLLSILWRSGASINCLMALRMTASNSLHYYLKNSSDLSNNISLEELTKLPSRDYKRVYNLVRHVDNRTGSSFFQYSLMALFLNDCLVEAKYYEKEFSLEEKQIVGSFILRNLQILQYNTHEIFELHKSEESGSATKTVFIGGGIYPTLALFNHSCDPGILKYFNGTTVCVHSAKPIGIGQTIAENYGPLYTQETRLERKAKMKDLYLFDCNCTACIEDWPKFEDMRSDIIRFRCDSDRKCSGVIAVPANCNDFMVKCYTCGQHTNILKGLKVMQDSEMIDKVAKRLYQSGDIRKALVKYIDLLKIMNEVVAPPFNDYCKCQQSIKDCFLHFGNSYISS